MSKAKWLLLLLLALGIAIPSYAVELTLGGFPSYMRTRAHFIKEATFINSMSANNARRLGFSDNDDNIMFVDTRLRLTPQLVLSDAVTIRAQVDVADNMIWGGTNSNLLGGGSTLVNSSVTPSDRFRGALLTNVGQGGAAAGGIPAAFDNVQFFNVRMLHMDVVLPHNLGFVRIGRQPFDWGLGILANGGWDPVSDLGFVLDRFLWLKSFGLGDAGSLTFVFVSDRFTQGNSLVTAQGDGWDGGAAAIIYNNPNVMGTNFTIGGYIFPYIHQTNVFAGTPGVNTPFSAPLTLDRFTLYAGLIDIKTDLWRLVGEIQGGWGDIELAGGGEIDIDASNILFAIRAEVYPGWPVKLIAAEFGWAGGDDMDTGNSLEGNVIVFSPAYNLDNLLFKHMIPNIYRIEGSVINAFYARAWGTVKLLDPISVTPQVVVAWADETNAPLFSSATFPGGGQNSISRYLGTELELTGTWQVHPGVNFDLIGSLVIAGSGLEQLLEQQASATLNTVLSDNTVPSQFDASSVPWAIQARVLIYIDQFFK
jgi:hypothetical protein